MYHSLTHTHTHTLSLTLSLSLTHPHTHTHTHTIQDLAAFAVEFVGTFYLCLVASLAGIAGVFGPLAVGSVLRSGRVRLYAPAEEPRLEYLQLVGTTCW